MGEIFQNFYSSLYKRPMVELSGYAARHHLSGHLFAYLNYGGVTGSAKDALAEGMLALAVEQHKLQPHQPVIEISGGTFAVALTVAAHHSGYPVYLVMPGTIMPDRQRMLTDLGAKVELTNYVFGREGMLQRAQELVKTTGGYFLDYFSNDNNPEFHRRVTGPAILKAAGEPISAVVAGVGSGGTITGTAEYLKAWAGKVWAIAVQPYESQTLTGGFAGRHGIAGLGAGAVPGNYNPYVVNEVISVSTGDALRAAREVLLTDAVPASVSSGAVLCAARERMRKEPGRVVCVFNGMSVLE